MTKPNQLKTNPIRDAADAFGGQTQFCKLLNTYGAQVHRQTVHNWVLKGVIPFKYRFAIQEFVKRHSPMIPNPAALIACVETELKPRGPTVFPNAKLAEWIKARGGPAKVCNEMNELIRESGYDKPGSETPTVKYREFYRWLERGVIPEPYHMGFIFGLGCPETAVKWAPIAATTGSVDRRTIREPGRKWNFQKRRDEVVQESSTVTNMQQEESVINEQQSAASIDERGLLGE